MAYRRSRPASSADFSDAPNPIIPVAPRGGPFQAPTMPPHWARNTPTPTPPSAVSSLPAAPWLGYTSPPAHISGLLSPGQSVGDADVVMIDILQAKPTSAANSKHLHIVYDIRDYPENAALNTRPQKVQLSDTHLEAYLTDPPVSSIKVVSKAFPWVIDVDSGDESVPITVGDLIAAIHSASFHIPYRKHDNSNSGSMMFVPTLSVETLQKLVTRSEWWIVTDLVREEFSQSRMRHLSVDAYHRFYP